MTKMELENKLIVILTKTFEKTELEQLYELSVKDWRYLVANAIAENITW